MREEARVIQKEVSLLLDDVGRLTDRVLNLQRHFGQAQDDIGQIITSSEKITKRGARIEALEFDEPAAQPPLAKLPLKGSIAAEVSGRWKAASRECVLRGSLRSQSG